MKLSLRVRLLVGFLAVIAITSVYSIYVGAQLARRNKAPRIPDRVGITGTALREEGFDDRESSELFFFLAVTILAILCAVLFSLAFARAVVRPVDSLIASARRVSEGAPGPVAPTAGAPVEIEAMAQAFNAMAASIRERDEKLLQRTQQEVMRAERLAIIGRLAAGVAHEINNPLGSILLFTRLILQKTPGEGMIRENLERIEKETMRCHGIVRGLLDFARPREPRAEAVDLNSVLDKAIHLFQNQPLCHNIEIVRQYEKTLPMVRVDPSQILQVFANIVMNAVDAMNGQGRVDVVTRLVENGRMVEASFRDTGCGIPDEVIDRIFEPFFTTKKVGQGTGLGLSISHSIVQRHGGTIRAESVEGKGSIFFVALPVDGGSQ